MQCHAISHGSFSIERVYPASPARVFAAWASLEMKARWFIGPEKWVLVDRKLDFRVGGEELLRGRYEQSETLFEGRYYDIVPDQRIVFTYDMHAGGRHHSLSVAAVEISPAGSGARLLFTEQVMFLDGTVGVDGTASRERGTADHFDRLARLF